MRIRGVLISVSVVAGLWIAKAGEVSILALRDMSDVEVKSAGIVVPREITFHVKALGGGGSGEGMFSRGGRMFAYGWIINADNRSLVWRMTADNTSQAHDDRSFDGEVTLGPGNYEVYFTAYAFVSHTFFSHWETNVDHRQNPLFGKGGKGHKGFFSFFTDLWADDITKEWGKRSKNWGIELLSDESLASSVKSFSAPKEMANVVLKATGLADGALVRQGFSLTKPLSLRVYALGEGESGDDLADYGWIVDTRTRKRVWEMDSRDVSPAGGAEKNVEFTGDVRLEKGDYALYYITDDSHSMADWNQAPPDDPLNYGITITVGDPKDVKIVKPYTYEEDKNLIVAITRVGNNENRTSGFTLKSDCAVRVYAFGERGNSRAQMADYGYIMDAKTRQKVWTMDVDRTSHGGGASKNRFVDEVIPLEKGSYIVAYNTDDSHAYGDWNADPPFDQDHYGISVMGMCDKFSAAMVAKYVEERDKNIIVQIVRVGDNANKSERFVLDRATRVRIYAIGEGQNREMYDYGWIEDAKTGNVIWEMTYGMTFYAGGGRKNRMVNTTIMLDKGEYALKYRSDDSHSFGDWNVDPPDDPQYWGITLYRDEGPSRTIPPPPPKPPEEGEED